MRAILSPDLQEKITSKYLFIDNDFLNEIYHDEDLLVQFTELVYERSYPIIDPLIEFEFSRSITAPLEAEKIDLFMRSELFFPVAKSQEIFTKIQENAFILSKIYASHGGKGTGKHASLVDLFLAGRVMTYSPGVAFIVASNTIDYPSCVFDVVGSMTKRQRDDRLQTFAFLSFNFENFHSFHKA